MAFEGADLTGKTSLIAALQRRMPYSMWPLLSIHSSKEALREPGGAAVNAAGVAFYSAVAAMARTMPVILDRCYVTNYVYGRVFGREPDFDVITGVAARLRPRVIYVYTPLEVLLERLKWRGDDFVDRKTLVMIYDGYVAWCGANPFDDEIVRVDSTVASDLDALAEMVAGQLETAS